MLSFTSFWLSCPSLFCPCYSTCHIQSKSTRSYKHSKSTREKNLRTHTHTHKNCQSESGEQRDLGMANAYMPFVMSLSKTCDNCSFVLCFYLFGFVLHIMAYVRTLRVRRTTGYGREMTMCTRTPQNSSYTFSFCHFEMVEELNHGSRTLFADTTRWAQILSLYFLFVLVARSISIAAERIMCDKNI